MEDYPRDLLEFEVRFASEEACRDYLSALRWPEGFRCPGCGHERAWPVRKVWFECARCGRQTSVTSGTIFQDTRKPLRLWFRAIWHVTSQKNGVSALGLQRVLGLGSYQTAVGAKCAQPDRPVICFTGDGGFYYHLAELETAARYGINTVIVVNNNRSLNQRNAHLQPGLRWPTNRRL